MKTGPKTMPYKEAREIARKICLQNNITTRAEWLEYARTYGLPKHVRRYPDECYANFKGWKDWLADDLRREMYRAIGMQVLGNLKRQDKSMAWLARYMGVSRELVRQKLSGITYISNEELKMFERLGLM